jgi:hypothetical protein
MAGWRRARVLALAEDEAKRMGEVQERPPML